MIGIIKSVIGGVVSLGGMFLENRKVDAEAYREQVRAKAKADSEFRIARNARLLENCRADNFLDMLQLLDNKNSRADEFFLCLFVSPVAYALIVPEYAPVVTKTLNDLPTFYVVMIMAAFAARLGIRRIFTEVFSTFRGMRNAIIPDRRPVAPRIAPTIPASTESASFADKDTASPVSPAPTQLTYTGEESPPSRSK